MPSFDSWLAEVKRGVREISPADLASSTAAPLVVDVRETDELAGGRIPGALAIPRGVLELRIEKAADDRARPLVLYCGGGFRSGDRGRPDGRWGGAGERIGGGISPPFLLISALLGLSAVLLVAAAVMASA